MFNSALSYYRLGRISSKESYHFEEYFYIIFIFLLFNFSPICMFSFIIVESLFHIRTRNFASVTLQNLAPASKKTIYLSYLIEAGRIFAIQASLNLIYAFFVGYVPYKVTLSSSQNISIFIFMLFLGMLAWCLGLLATSLKSFGQRIGAFGCIVLLIYGLMKLLSFLFPASGSSQLFSSALMEQIALSEQYYMYPIVAGGLMLLSMAVCIPIHVKKVY